MKLLLDQNLSFKLVAALHDVFPGSNHVRPLGLDAADDRTIWDYAARNGFTLVTLDGDFAELSALRGSPPKVVWLRCGNHPTSMMRELLLRYAPKIIVLDHEPFLDCLEIDR